jgi:hypothetical protein
LNEVLIQTNTTCSPAHMIGPSSCLISRFKAIELDRPLVKAPTTTLESFKNNKRESRSPARMRRTSSDAKAENS